MAKNPKTNIVPLHEVSRKTPSGEQICLQFGRYKYGKGRGEDLAFRFIRKDINENMKAQRGQCGSASLQTMKDLIAEAEAAGWGKQQGTMQ